MLPELLIIFFNRTYLDLFSLLKRLNCCVPVQSFKVEN